MGCPSRSPVDVPLFVNIVQPRPFPHPAQISVGSGGMSARDVSPAALPPRERLDKRFRDQSLGFQVLARRSGARRKRSLGPDSALVRSLRLDPRRRLDGLHASRTWRTRGQERPAFADPQAVQSLELCDQGGRWEGLVAELVLRQGEQAGWGERRCRRGNGYADYSDCPDERCGVVHHVWRSERWLGSTVNGAERASQAAGAHCCGSSSLGGCERDEIGWSGLDGGWWRAGASR